LNMQLYECRVCGYIYDPASGDAKGEVPPGTGFDSLAPDWICPWCDADRGEFHEYPDRRSVQRGAGK